MKDIYKKKVNMSIKRLFVMAMVMCFALGSLVACGKDDAEQEVSTESVLAKAGTVQLYQIQRLFLMKTDTNLYSLIICRRRLRRL